MQGYFVGRKYSGEKETIPFRRPPQRRARKGVIAKAYGWRLAHQGLLRREPINVERPADVRFGADNELMPDMAPCPTSANRRYHPLFNADCVQQHLWSMLGPSLAHLLRYDGQCDDGGACGGEGELSRQGRGQRRLRRSRY